MINIIKKIIFGIKIFIVIFFITMASYAKYVIDEEFEIANIDIDLTSPKIYLISVSNVKDYNEVDNNLYNNIITIKVEDRNLNKTFFDKEHIRVKINNNELLGDNMEFINIKDLDEEKLYQIKLKNVKQDDDIVIQIEKGMAVDKFELSNDEVEFKIKEFNK